MVCWDSDMPNDVARAYAVWESVAAGNVSETARLLGLRRPTVQDWSKRYHWRERLANQRAEDRDRTIAHAWAMMAADLPNAVETVLAARSSVYDESGRPTPGSPTPLALKAAALELAVFGFAPMRTAPTFVADTAELDSISSAEVNALVAAGDTESLIALAQGRPLPTRTREPHPPPGDFTSDQPGGRVGSDPSPLITIDADFRTSKVD